VTTRPLAQLASVQATRSPVIGAPFGPVSANCGFALGHPSPPPGSEPTAKPLAGVSRNVTSWSRERDK
jgi:hypothetical protein